MVTKRALNGGAFDKRNGIKNGKWNESTLFSPRPRCINIFACFWIMLCSSMISAEPNYVLGPSAAEFQFLRLSHMAAAHENCQMHWNVARQSTRKIIKLSNGARSKWSSWSLKNGVKTVGMNTIGSLTGNFNFEAHRKRFLLQLNCNSLSPASFSNEIMENLIKPNEQ